MTTRCACSRVLFVSASIINCASRELNPAPPVMRILMIVRCAPLHGLLYDNPTNRRSMSPWTRAAGINAMESLKTLQARRCAAPRATFPRRIAPLNDPRSGAMHFQQPQDAVEDARRNTRANAPTPHRGTIYEIDRTRASFGGSAPSPARRVVEKQPRGYF